MRPTTDVDIVVETSTRLAYHDMEEQLSRLGLVHDTREGAPLCRWLTPDAYVLDVMPTHEDVLGFTNQWYAMALSLAEPFDLGEGTVIRIPPAPVFIATKWEAFANRGEGDYLGSHDLEDVITVVAGRPELLQDVSKAPEEVRCYIEDQARAFLEADLSSYAIQGALPDAAHLPEIIPQTMSRFRDLTDMPEHRSVIGDRKNPTQE